MFGTGAGPQSCRLSARPPERRSAVEIQLVAPGLVSRPVAEGVVDAAHGLVVVGRVCQQPTELGVPVAGLADRLGLDPAGEAAPAMLAEYAGAVMLGVAFAICGN